MRNVKQTEFVIVKLCEKIYSYIYNLIFSEEFKLYNLDLVFQTKDSN